MSYGGSAALQAAVFQRLAARPLTNSVYPMAGQSSKSRKTWRRAISPQGTSTTASRCGSKVAESGTSRWANVAGAVGADSPV